MSDNEQNIKYTRERIRVGRDYVEIDIEGPEEYVERRMNNAMRQVSDSIETIQQNLLISQSAQSPKQLKLFDDEERSTVEQTEHLTAGESAFEPEIHLNGNVTKVEISLLNFFLLKSPKSQSDQVLVITYYYHHYLGLEHLTLDDYETAYKQLKKAAVKPPANMKSGVRNVVDRTDLLFNPERGAFALTIQGEEFVENMEKEV